MGGITRVTSQALQGSQGLGSAARLDAKGLQGETAKLAQSILGFVPGLDAGSVAGKAMEAVGGKAADLQGWLTGGLASFGSLQQRHGLGEEVVSLPTQPFPPLGGLAGATPRAAAAGAQAFQALEALRPQAGNLAGLLKLAEPPDPGRAGVANPPDPIHGGGGSPALADVADMARALLQLLDPQRPGDVGGRVVIR
jgi:hypothetical protein